MFCMYVVTGPPFAAQYEFFLGTSESNNIKIVDNEYPSVVTIIPRDK